MLNVAHLGGFEGLAHPAGPLSHFLSYFLFPCSLLHTRKKFSQDFHPAKLFSLIFIFHREYLLTAVSCGLGLNNALSRTLHCVIATHRPDNLS